MSVPAPVLDKSVTSHTLIASPIFATIRSKSSRNAKVLAYALAEEDAMQRVTDQVDSAYLERVPPRPLHTNVMLNLLNDHLYERLSRIVLDPITIASAVILIGLVIMRASPLLRLIPVLLIFARLGIEGRYIW